MFQAKFIEKIKKMYSIAFPENCAIYEIMREKTGRTGQAT
jgi:hypothetical protein